MTPAMPPAATHRHLNEALAGLLDKYAVPSARPWWLADGPPPPGGSGGAQLFASGCFLDESDLPESTVPLLPWQYERRFVELRRLIEEDTVAPLLMCRFACLSDGREMPLSAILYRQFDLVEWLSGAPIVAIHASMAGAENGDTADVPERPEGCLAQVGPVPSFRTANAIVRLATGVVGSVEAGTTLPAGAAMQDRHELIARRGVASDRVVDTQVAQSSVYAWTADGCQEHTDVDAELFGLGGEQVSLVRAAYDALCQPVRTGPLREQHRRLRHLVALAYESDRQGRRLAVEGGSA